jgi:hypothetical protein
MPSIQSTSCTTTKPWPLLTGEQQKLKHSLSGLDSFHATQACLGSEQQTGLAIDERTKKICLIQVEKQAIHRRLIPYIDLLGAEVIEDGYGLSSTFESVGECTAQRAISQSATSATRASSFALLPNRQKAAKVTVIALKLTLREPISNDTTVGVSLLNPVHVVKFLSKETPRGSTAHRAALDKANHWYKLILTLLHLESLRNTSLLLG